MQHLSPAAVYLLTDGDGYNRCVLKLGGGRYPVLPEDPENSKHHLGVLIGFGNVIVIIAVADRHR